MLCDICKEKEATVHLTQMVEGKTKKIDLCEGCSKAKGVDDPAGFSLADADAVKGSYISKAVTWGHGKRRSLGAHAGRALRLRVALADAELYSVAFRCAAQ